MKRNNNKKCPKINRNERAAQQRTEQHNTSTQPRCQELEDFHYYVIVFLLYDDSTFFGAQLLVCVTSR